MGKIVVKLAGRELFDWSGGRRELRDLTRRIERAAKSVGKTVPELSGLTLQSVLSAKSLSPDLAVRDMQIGGIVHYLLQMPGGRHGSHGSDVGQGASLSFDLRTEALGKVRIEVEEHPVAESSTPPTGA